ncbi:Organic hydroperoxide reductase OsmC/OhrA [Mucilaginibacter mallensis]|uniref:Organic hydroperoxide reductase OsmC/OhrA n=1 Tax=Mucilaginibacter mallensis TaxID=652787 RepID=A0A1H1ZZQ0_MUCMA|nr:OsmC family protein [Mucilaginibacter mallensis]SDT39194.1 Organic hydroperoxide reductase OsmC/OhrA [Mucilaginibacter mallensis]
MKTHQYKTNLTWTGNLGKGTSAYRDYSRNHELNTGSKPLVPASSDPAFRGDGTRYNPEELLVMSISSCHMLWYLHLCSEAGVIVVDYTDAATGTMTETANGGGHFTEVTLHPLVIVNDAAMVDKANELHHKANELCFIANSCNFPILHKPVCEVLSK